MSTVFPIDRAYRISTQDNGNIGSFGPGSLSDLSAWVFDFVPDQSFQGAIVPMARGGGVEVPDSVGFVAVPYRAAFLNGAPPVTPYGYVTDAMTGRSVFQVPGGWNIGLLIACTAGFGWLYSRPLMGAPDM